MSSPHSAYFAWCGTIVVASLVFVVPTFATVPLFWYYPLAHAWALEARPAGFALDWYGRTIWALMGAAAAFPVALAVARRLPPPSARAFFMWAAWAGMTSLLAITVYTYQLAHRHPVPEPLPVEYQARSTTPNAPRESRGLGGARGGAGRADDVLAPQSSAPSAPLRSSPL